MITLCTRLIAPIGSLLIAASCFGQLAVVSRPAIQLSGIEDAEKIGDAVFVASDANLRTEPVIIITAESEAANIAFEVSDQNRTPVEFEQLSAKIIVVRSPGKSWVDVTAIDFEKNIYARKLVVIELGEGPDPDPDPTPIPPDPPLPPDGPFDALAVRVAVIAAGMAQSERDALIKLLTEAADKMERYDFRTLEHVREFVEDGWTNTVPAKQLLELLADDSKDRVLGWDEAIAYYREVIKGLQ
jgi:hypothetical protein